MLEGDFSTWNVPDEHDVLEFEFEPLRNSGNQLPPDLVPESELDFFQLFLSDETIDKIVEYTNEYAWLKIVDKPYYAKSDGSWEEVTHDDIKKFIAFLIYAGLVPVTKYTLYWSTASLYKGLWARAFFSRDRFMAIASFFSC